MLDATLTPSPAAPGIAGRFRRLDPALLPIPWLVAVAAASLAIYGGYFARNFWLPDNYPGPFADLPYLLGATYRGLASWVGLVSFLFLLWAIALRAAAGLPPRFSALALILMIGAAQLGSLLLTYPVTNSDVFHYTAEARVLWQHGANPLITPPEAYSFPDIEPNMWWWWTPSPYGPLWSIIAWLPYQLGGGDAARTVVAFKALSSVFWLATAALTYYTVALRSPRQAPFAAVFVALNPLAALLIAIGGQNDTAMMFFVALGLFLLGRRGWTPAPSAFAAAVLIKPVAALAIPLALLYMWRRTSVGSLVLAWALAVVVVAGSYAPFWEGTTTLSALSNQATYLTTSPATILALVLDDSMTRPLAEDVARVIGSVIFISIAGVLTLRWLRRGRLAVPEVAGWVIAAYLMTAAFWWQPWYLLWLLVPAAMSGSWRLQLMAAVFSWSAIMVYSMLFGYYLWWFGRADDVPVQIAGSILVFVPPLLALIVPPIVQGGLGSRLPSVPRTGRRPEPLPARHR